MVRGTTPTHVFKLPDALDGVDTEELELIYTQDNVEVLRKTPERDGLNVYVKLTAEETSLFSPYAVASRVCARAVLEDGSVIISAPERIEVYEAPGGDGSD